MAPASYSALDKLLDLVLPSSSIYHFSVLFPRRLSEPWPTKSSPLPCPMFNQILPRAEAPAPRKTASSATSNMIASTKPFTYLPSDSSFPPISLSPIVFTSTGIFCTNGGICASWYVTYPNTRYLSSTSIIVQSID